MVGKVFTSGLAILCFLLSWRAAAQPPDPNVAGRSAVPFHLIANLIMVEAVVNGQQGLFILDTGTEELTLNAAYVDQAMGTNTIKDFRGNATNFKTAYFSFSLGGIYFKRKRAFIADLRHLEKRRNIRIAGLIGYRVLRNHEMILDYDAKMLTFFELDRRGNRLNSSPAHEEPARTFPFKLRGHLACIELNIGKEKLQAALDTGSGLNVFHQGLQKQLAAFNSEDKATNINGLSRQSYQSVTVKMEGVKLADMPCPPMRTLFAPLFALNDHITGGGIDALLGYEFLRHFKISLNFRKKELSIWVRDRGSAEE